MRSIPVFLLLAALAGPALGHSKMDETVPADKAVLSAAPTQIELTFAKKIRLTRVQINSDGGTSDLDLSGHKSFATRFALPVALPGAGDYGVEWRGLSGDGHIMNGTFRFKVE